MTEPRENVEEQALPDPNETIDVRDLDDDGNEIIEPDYTEDVVTGLEPDPVTARQTDPAAMSEHERNLRQTEQYNTGL